MLWLSFRFDAPLLNVPMTYFFTLFSHVLWSIYVLFSIGLMECVVWRKKVISAAAGPCDDHLRVVRVLQHARDIDADYFSWITGICISQCPDLSLWAHQ
jgi:hypothetical protein